MKNRSLPVHQLKVRTHNVEFNRIGTEFKDNGIALEGPFLDPSGRICKIASKIIRGTSDRLEDTLSALFPFNWAPGSVLDVPYVCKMGQGCTRFEEARLVAGAPTLEYGGRTVRGVSQTELTLLAVAVLRHLEVPSYFALMTVCQETNEAGEEGTMHRIDMQVFPSVFVDRKNALYTYYPHPFPAYGDFISLDIFDPALIKLYLTSVISRDALDTLSDRVSEGKSHPEGQKLEAAVIGHSVYYSLDNVPGRVIVISSPPKDALSVIHQDAIKPLLESETHLRHARRKFLQKMEEPVLEKIREVEAAEEAGSISKPSKLGAIACNPALMRYVSYLALYRLMREHIHPAGECPDYQSGGSQDAN